MVQDIPWIHLTIDMIIPDYRGRSIIVTCSKVSEWYVRKESNERDSVSYMISPATPRCTFGPVFL